ncbi:hypothetical protein VTN00DRAFT_5347 [Thermoascus crustaceus]|uniref:uncharacterized protein n=1 Tax=Thermoascus crustaceus TaxID=5088 RepID=UPI003742A0F1
MLRVMSVVDGTGGIADLSHESRCMEARRDLKENGSSNSHKFKIKIASSESSGAWDLVDDLAISICSPFIFFLQAFTGSQVETLYCYFALSRAFHRCLTSQTFCLQLHHMVNGPRMSLSCSDVSVCLVQAGLVMVIGG